MDIRVQNGVFDFGQEASQFATRQSQSGAIVTFSGVVRDTEAGLISMEIEHYPGMTQTQLTKFAQSAKARFDLEDVLVIHRFGCLQPGDIIMMVATAARHRKAAFDGAEFLMDYLKSRAPFWKRETTRAGTAGWVDARDVDEDALTRWTEE